MFRSPSTATGDIIDEHRSSSDLTAALALFARGASLNGQHAEGVRVLVADSFLVSIDVQEPPHKAPEFSKSSLAKKYRRKTLKPQTCRSYTLAFVQIKQIRLKLTGCFHFFVQS